MASLWQTIKSKASHAVQEGVEGFSDPWASFDIHGIHAERVRRHRYMSATGKSLL